MNILDQISDAFFKDADKPAFNVSLYTGSGGMIQFSWAMLMLGYPTSKIWIKGPYRSPGKHLKGWYVSYDSKHGMFKAFVSYGVIKVYYGTELIYTTDHFDKVEEFKRTYEAQKKEQSL